MPRDYKVGYGRPPKEHQFRKGQSGNPKGRPQKKGIETVDVLGILDESVDVRVNGKRRRLSSFELSVRSLAKMAMTDLGAADEFLSLCEKYGLIKTPPPDPRDHGVVMIPLSWDHDEFLEMLNKHGAPPWPGPRPGLPDSVNPPD